MRLDVPIGSPITCPRHLGRQDPALILLTQLPPAQVDTYLAMNDICANTEWTVTDRLTTSTATKSFSKWDSRA